MTTVIQVIHLGEDYGKVAVHNDEGGEVQEYEIPRSLAVAIAVADRVVKGVHEELK